MMTESQLASYSDNYRALMQFSARYRADEALRARIENGDYGELRGMVPSGTEVRVVCQTPEVYYMPMPEDPNVAVSDELLGSVAGGSTNGCVSSVMTGGTVPSCISSISSVGTASSQETPGS